jgi:hypothetical protein
VPLQSAILSDDKVIRCQGWAQGQRSRTGRGTILAIHVIVEVFNLLRNRSMVQKLKARSPQRASLWNAVRGHEKIRTDGHERSALMATKVRSFGHQKSAPLTEAPT